MAKDLDSAATAAVHAFLIVESVFKVVHHFSGDAAGAVGRIAAVLSHHTFGLSPFLSQLSF